jgi:YVTN family beta-propeller protein
MKQRTRPSNKTANAGHRPSPHASPRAPLARRGAALTLALLVTAAVGLSPACGGAPSTSTSSGEPPSSSTQATTSSTTLALTDDDRQLWVVNPDADSVSVIDTEARALLAEIPLGPSPTRDPVTKRFDPKVAPRALAFAGEKVFVAGEAASRIFVLDAVSRKVRGSIPVPAAPSAVAVSKDARLVYVVSHEAAMVTVIDAVTEKVVGGAAVSEHPWGVTLSADGREIFVTHLLLEPGVTTLDAATLAFIRKVPLADEPRKAPFDKRLPNGVARGAYGATPRPGSGELWVPHLLLAVETAQPDLDFESTVFPTISTLAPDGAAEGRRLLFKPQGASATGAFTDSVSGPRALAFTPDGKLALVALAQSEDVMVFDAETGNEVSLVRPMRSALLEGIAMDHAGKRAYVDGRNTHDVTVLAIDPSRPIAPVSVSGAPIERLSHDPMPNELRRGQRLFYTANSAAFPVTKNFWVACASCHIEGGSDAVTWLFEQGPRDTPSNAGGPINTGFLLRQATRTSVTQYDEIINAEQGGNYSHDKPAQRPDLEALAAFVNYAIPLPPNPYLAEGGALSAAQQRGQATFASACASCHDGPFFTDSAKGNPERSLDGPVMLHDIGTCVTSGSFPDRKYKDVDGKPRTACDFDTPTLRGIFATAPYFHDGSARTLGDVVDRLSFSAKLSGADKADLVAYLLTL